MKSGEYLEREARLKLGLRKEGEQVVVLRKEGASAPSSDSSPAAPAAEPDWSNPKKWRVMFIDPKAYEAYADSRRVAGR